MRLVRHQFRSQPIRVAVMAIGFVGALALGLAPFVGTRRDGIACAAAGLVLFGMSHLLAARFRYTVPVRNVTEVTHL